jgi:hypothetical protein
MGLSTHGRRQFIVRSPCAALAFAALLMWPLKLAVAQLSTTDHLADPGFWPTQINPPTAQFVGPTVCAECHSEIYASQVQTAMAGTAHAVADSIVLKTHSHLDFHIPNYTYEIVTKGDQAIFTVSDGAHSESDPLIWAFGIGVVGQSFLYKKDNQWYEARATYFQSLDNLNFTPARALASPRDLEEAMARPVPPAEVMRCFTCHSTGVTTLESVDTSHLFLGVTCEACHGPGGKHVEALREEKMLTGSFSGQVGKNLIFNPARLDLPDAVDFCGACHSTWWDVRLSGVSGVPSVRSPSYRLENSKCWGQGQGDKRLSCFTCHDPHVKLVRDSRSYDSKCLACHVASADVKTTPDHPGRSCPVSKDNCVSCHMPKVLVPELHYQFTDHDIRIVRPGAPFPP